MRFQRLWLIAGMICLTAVSSVLAADKPEVGQPSSQIVGSSAYPLDYCIVTGEKLGDMGSPVVKTYDGREVKFCCNACIKSFEKDQARWMKKLDNAIVAAQQESYPLKTCVVSGEKLGEMGKPVDYIHNNRLVRFCCGGCIETFKADPAKYLSVIDAAQTSKTSDTEKPTQSDEHHSEGTGH